MEVFAMCLSTITFFAFRALVILCTGYAFATVPQPADPTGEASFHPV